MAHPKDDEVYPIDTVVRRRKTGEFAIINEVELEALPPEK